MSGRRIDVPREGARRESAAYVTGAWISTREISR